MLNGAECVPISINHQPKKESIETATTAQIIDLLSNNNYQISKNNIVRNIKPSDIGILVRSNKEGIQIKRNLAQHGFVVPLNGELDKETRNVLIAFQMKYRPANFDGTPDAETATLLDVLTSPSPPAAK